MGRRIRQWWRSLRLRDVIILTLPLVAAALYLVVGSVLNYRHIAQFGDWWGEQATVHAAFRSRLDAVLQAPRAAALRRNLDPLTPDAGGLRLELDPAAWELVQGDPLGGWGVWSDATLVTGSGRVSVAVRKRGDTSVHFTTEKTSFTVRMPRTSLLAGVRDLGVSGKNVLSSWLANQLPAEFGVMAPRTAIAPVYVNNRFYGMFRLIEPVDEGFLRHAGRMPGNVFRADAAERGEYRKGLERNVFWNAAAWDWSASIDSVPGMPSRGGLIELLAALNGGTFEQHRAAMSRVERPQLVRLLAAALVVGDPYHMSNVHNQYWFEDPTSGLMAPIPWDLRLTPLSSPPGRLNNFLQGAVRDPLVVDGVLRLLARKLAGDSLYRRAAELTAGVWTEFEPHLRYDLLRRRAIMNPGTPDEILNVLRANIDTLRERIADSRMRAATGFPVAGTAVLDLETAGWAGSELTEVRLPAQTGRVRLFADRDRDGRPGPDDAEVPVREVRSGRGLTLQLIDPLPLLSTWYGPDLGLLPGRVHYRLYVIGDVANAGGIEPVLRNPYTGGPVTVLPWVAEQQGADRGWSAWQYPQRQPGPPLVLAGNVLLTENLVIPDDGRLEIAPGTTVRLAEGVSILARGRVVARGTPAAPIRIEPAVAGVPWGTFALQGAGASGSVFEHVTFREGSSARLERVGYKGMVSVHHADHVVFNQVRFERNLRSDDAFNAVHATVEIVDCDIVDTNSDGLDFDYSGGVVRQSRFVGTRGDALDLMTSTPLITGNHIEGSGDKGISVGERSRPIIVDNAIMKGNRGIEVKDASRPFIVHNVITGNRIGLLQNVKNWRYGQGAWATVAFSEITGNDVDVQADERSLLTAVHNRIGTPADASAGAHPAAVIAEVPPHPAANGVRPDWIYASLGLAGDGTPGRLRAPAPVTPSQPLVLEEYAEELGGRDLAWTPLAGIERMVVQDAELVIAVEGRHGTAAHPLGWDLEDAGRRYQVAVELGGTGLERVRLRFMEGVRVRAETAIGLTDDPGRRHLVTIELPPARYTELRIEAVPRRGAQRIDPVTGLLEPWTGRLRIGRIQLHGWQNALDLP